MLRNGKLLAQFSNTKKLIGNGLENNTATITLADAPIKKKHKNTSKHIHQHTHTHNNKRNIKQNKGAKKMLLQKKTRIEIRMSYVS